MGPKIEQKLMASSVGSCSSSTAFTGSVMSSNATGGVQSSSPGVDSRRDRPSGIVKVLPGLWTRVKSKS